MSYGIWCARGGPGHRYASSGQALLDVSKGKLSWLSRVFCNHPFRQSVVMDESQVIAGGSGLVAALDSRTGKPIWSARVDTHFENQAAMSERFVLVGDFLLERAKGKIVLNIADELGVDRELGWCQVFRYREGFFREVYKDGAVAMSVAIDGEGKLRKLHESQYSVMALDGESGILLASTSASPDGISRLDPDTGETLWMYEPPRTSKGDRYYLAWPVIAEGHIYIWVYDDSVMAIDAQTGVPAWLAGNKSQAERGGLGSMPSQVLVSGRRVVLTNFIARPGVDHRFMACFDSQSGAGLWEIPMRTRCDHMCIAGPYVFGTQDKQPVAWSLETGEETWRGDELLDSVGVLAHGNRVIYETAYSELLCYEF